MTTSAAIVLQMAENCYTPNRSLKLKVLKLNGTFILAFYSSFFVLFTRKHGIWKCEMSLLWTVFMLALLKLHELFSVAEWDARKVVGKLMQSILRAALRAVVKSHQFLRLLSDFKDRKNWERCTTKAHFNSSNLVAASKANAKNSLRFSVFFMIKPRKSRLAERAIFPHKKSEFHWIIQAQLNWYPLLIELLLLLLFHRET